MKVYAIFANDNRQGVTHKMFEHAIATLQTHGHQIDILDLYQREKEIPFFRHNRAYMESHPFYTENKERFLQADILLLVFPLFWYSVPGILKTWLDLINGWAYDYQSGVHGKAKHHIKKVIVLYAAMQQKTYLEQTLHSPVQTQLTETCKFIGIDHVESYVIDDVNNMPQEILNKHLEAIAIICTKV